MIVHFGLALIIKLHGEYKSIGFCFKKIRKTKGKLKMSIGFDRWNPFLKIRKRKAARSDLESR